MTKITKGQCDLCGKTIGILKNGQWNFAVMSCELKQEPNYVSLEKDEHCYSFSKNCKKTSNGYCTLKTRPFVAAKGWSYIDVCDECMIKIELVMLQIKHDNGNAESKIDASCMNGIDIKNYEKVLYPGLESPLARYCKNLKQSRPDKTI